MKPVNESMLGVLRKLLDADGQAPYSELRAGFATLGALRRRRLIEKLGDGDYRLTLAGWREVSPSGCEAVSVPWPERYPVTIPTSLRIGEVVYIGHISRPEWSMRAVVVGLTQPGRSIRIWPAEPVTSPANWIVK